MTLDEARRSAADYLLSRQQEWQRTTEKDVNEPGTDWLHLTYAEAVRGIAAGTRSGLAGV